MNTVNSSPNHEHLVSGKSKIDVWENFRGRDINRWAFRNIDKFASHQVIHSSNSPLNLISHYPPEKLNDNQILPEYIDEMPGTLRYLYTDAIVILHKGSIIHEAYFDGMHPQDPHLLFSVSKLFAGVLIYQLVGTGLIRSESDSISDYLPGLRNPLFSKISIQNLLDMQSGIDTTRLKESDYLDRACGFAPPINNENIRELLRQIQSLKFEPGQSFDYQTLNSDILSLLMTAITGKPVAELIEMNLFKPMGAEYDAFMICDPCGISELGGGLAVTARDLARFGLQILNDGYINNRQVMPGGYLKTILASYEPQKWSKGWLSNLTPQAKGYRYHTYVAADSFANGAVFGVGNFGNVLFIDPRSETIIVIFSSYPNGVDINRFGRLMELVQSITRYIRLNMK